MTRMTLKVKVNYLHFQHQSRVSQDACLVLICDSSSNLWRVILRTSYSLQTDGQADGQTQATTIPFLTQSVRGKNEFHNVMCDIIFWFFICVLSMYNFSRLKTKWDPQIKVYHYFTKHIVRDIIHKTVLKVKICEKYKISDILFISRIKILSNTSIFIHSLKMYFQAAIRNKEKWAIPKLLIALKKLYLAFSEDYLRPKLSNVTCRFRILDNLNAFWKEKLSIVMGVGVRGSYLSHGL